MRGRSILIVCLLVLILASPTRAANNPVPYLDQALSPVAAAPGGAGFTLTLHGGGFVSTSVIRWNGNARPTTFVTPSKISAAIPGSDIATAGSAIITVTNPSPGGGTSNAALFEISPVRSGSPQFTTLIQPNQNGLVINSITGDFNGDGKLDVGYAANTNFVVQLGNGDGSFQSPQVLPNVGPDIFATADFDEDGNLDVAIAGGKASSTLLLLGNGDGTFEPFQDPNNTNILTYFPSDIVAADFNRDGHADLLLGGTAWRPPVGTQSNPLVLYLGDGDGTFQPGTGIPINENTANFVGGLAVGDFNGDGILDIALQDGILIGHGDGTFQTEVPVAMRSGSDVVQTMVAADLNGDGKLDLIVGLSSSGVAVLLGNGDGTFHLAVNYPTGATPSCPCSVQKLAVADFDGDGKVDLMVSLDPAHTSSPLLILSGNGDGTFQAPVPYSVPSCTTEGAPFGGCFSAFGDFNNDGKLDLVADFNVATTGSSSSNLAIFLQGQFPIVAAAPVSLDFGTQALGTSGAAQPVTLTNSGTTPFVISSVTLVGASPSAFQIQSNTCGASLAANATCTITLIFDPGSVASFTAALLIAGNGPGVTVPMVGVAAMGAGPGGTPALNFSPTTLTFPGQFVGTTGLPQTVTVTNTGNATLSITSVTPSAPDFAVLSNCTNPVQEGANCTIGVFFDPTAAGTRTGALTFVDNGSGSPQTISLTGAGQDFSFATGGTSSATVTAGQTATYSLALASAGGFTQSVTLGCTGAPAFSTCTVNPSLVLLSKAGTTAVSVSVTTAAHSFVGPPVIVTLKPRTLLPLLWMLGILMMLIVVAWCQMPRLRWTPALAFVLLLCLGFTLTSCGGGSLSAGGGSGGGAGGTQAGTYTLVVSGSFSSGSTTLTHNTQLNLVVQ